MRDPVTGFEYPALWTKNCKDPRDLERIEKGLAILTASGTVLARGYTTGTTAAAACKAAILSLQKDQHAVMVQIPCGLIVDVPVEACKGHASCRKFAGDYPSDVTAGIEFVAHATQTPEGVRLIPGTGIGHFARDTPRYKKGEPAISAAPLACILAAMDEALAVTGIPGVEVSLSAPRGEEIAEKTLNSRVGVTGGISVLGTTGLVEPWDDHLTESMEARISASRHPVLTTGRVGLKFSRLLFPGNEVILIGGKIHEALAVAKDSVILCGLPALILRYINPQILRGTGYATVEELSASPHFDRLVEHTLVEFQKIQPRVRVVLLNRDGFIVGESP
ncbi:MAG: cobalt-precorrin-5B (C(1))-methyltransferase [Methanoregula sp.]